MAYYPIEKYTFKEGYFFTIGWLHENKNTLIIIGFPLTERFSFAEPGLYKQGQFGIRLKNVMEVINPNEKLPNGQELLSFRHLSLVPYETKLIDLSLLTSDEVFI